MNHKFITFDPQIIEQAFDETAWHALDRCACGHDYYLHMLDTGECTDCPCTGFELAQAYELIDPIQPIPLCPTCKEPTLYGENYCSACSLKKRADDENSGWPRAERAKYLGMTLEQFNKEFPE